jgi:putative glutamine amidotransferase
MSLAARSRLHLWPVRVALGILLGAASLTTASAEPVRLLDVPGLGPLLLVGKDQPTALQGYVDGLIKRRVFRSASQELRSWSRRLSAHPAEVRLEDLRRSGKPVIGIQLNSLETLTGGRAAAEESGALRVARAVRRAGGVAVFLPAGYDRARIPGLLSSVDHLVLLGGDDVHPRLYGQKITYAGGLRLERDRYEVALVRAALARHLGIDGICRGMQLLNVAAGGTLFQDIHKDGATRQAHSRPGFKVRRQLVRLEGQSASSCAIGGQQLWTLSVHHQAVRRAGDGLRVVGRSCDGLPEVIEGRSGAVRGYQFHPERSRSAPARAIFRDIVRRAREHDSARGR